MELIASEISALERFSMQPAKGLHFSSSRRMIVTAALERDLRTCIDPQPAHIFVAKNTMQRWIFNMNPYERVELLVLLMVSSASATPADKILVGRLLAFPALRKDKKGGWAGSVKSLKSREYMLSRRISWLS
jgi:hypothetical protein